MLTVGPFMGGAIATALYKFLFMTKEEPKNYAQFRGQADVEQHPDAKATSTVGEESFTNTN